MDDELKAVLGQLLTKMDGLATKADVEAVRTELKADIGAVRAELKSDIAAVDAKVDTVRAELKSDIAAVQAGQNELRQVTSSNHFKLVGRIDQVASMLADHMAEHDHTPAGGRKTA